MLCPKCQTPLPNDGSCCDACDWVEPVETEQQAWERHHPDVVLIWSFEHNMWWKADLLGYTTDRRQAGLYPRLDAMRILERANRLCPDDVPQEEIRETTVHDFMGLDTCLDIRCVMPTCQRHQQEVRARLVGLIRDNAVELEFARRSRVGAETALECGEGYRDPDDFGANITEATARSILRAMPDDELNPLADAGHALAIKVREARRP